MIRDTNKGPKRQGMIEGALGKVKFENRKQRDGLRQGPLSGVKVGRAEKRWKEVRWRSGENV